MAVNTKGKRKVKVGGRDYIWYVQTNEGLPDEGYLDKLEPERYLHIIATNKKFIVHYRIPQQGDDHALLRVEGEQFPRQPEAKEVAVPRWKHDTNHFPTADFVRRLIGWCMSTKERD